MTTCYNFKKWELAMQEERKGISRRKKEREANTNSQGWLGHPKAEREHRGQCVWSRERKGTE